VNTEDENAPARFHLPLANSGYRCTLRLAPSEVLANEGYAFDGVGAPKVQLFQERLFLPFFQIINCRFP
jgi:hypothetical protein